MATVVVLGILITGLSGTAKADPVIDFAVFGTGGSMTYAGGSNPLVGSLLPVSQIQGKNGTPVNDGVILSCVSCFLNFTSGPLAGTTATSWSFSSGGSLTLTGTVKNGATTIASGTLFSGALGGGSTVSAVPVPTLGVFSVMVGLLGSSINSNLTDFFGLPATPPNYNGGMNLSFLASSVPPGAFTSTTFYSGNVAVQTPEPLSIILLGTVLLGCAALVRRRQRGNV
jgi:hypothetical protein